MAAELVPKVVMGLGVLAIAAYFSGGIGDQEGGGRGLAPAAVDVSGKWIVTHTFDNGFAAVGRVDLTQDGSAISGTYTDLTGLASGMGFGLGTSLVEGKVSGRVVSLEIGPIDQGSVETTFESQTTITGDSNMGMATIRMSGGGKRVESQGSVEFARGAR